MITTNTILQIDITEELTCPHIAATHPSTPNLHNANESRPKSSRQAFFNSLLEQKFELSTTQARDDLRIFQSRFPWKVDYRRSRPKELYRSSLNVRWDNGKPLFEPKQPNSPISE
ncbi:MAG: hypothetical protein E5299_01925 [Burkholderia gladioli]|nr:MAG: hypothetical protein E5299_01925 [Burkholderia gladioli]